MGTRSCGSFVAHVVPTDDHLFNILPSDVKKGLLFDTVDGIAARWAAAMRYAGTNEQSSHNSALSAAR
jgi:hypothetical protein